ncbi:MAG TPA: hypothetical protein VFY21_06830 [Xanthobacteraceae bacterium]|nr:hypothetical protein [Xanthobacteraceae bacterium]
MRLLFGIVLGAILTIGGAYYRDSTYASASADVPVRPIVNWDVAGQITANATSGLRQEIDRLLSR